MSDNYDRFVAGQDVNIVTPDFTKLDRDQRMTKIAELFVRDAEYEASWDPACVSPGKDGQGDPDHSATGLYQLNVRD